MGTTTLNYFTNETPLSIVKQHISVLLDEITYLSTAYNIVEDEEDARQIDDLYT